jgi:hypothetical protein
MAPCCGFRRYVDTLILPGDPNANIKRQYVYIGQGGANKMVLFSTHYMAHGLHGLQMVRVWFIFILNRAVSSLVNVAV